MEYSETIPIQYQEGFTSFMGIEIKVDPRVLIPRPETELLVQVAADVISCPSEGRESHIMDLCTGSGAIAIALCCKLPHVKVVASDISADALEVASMNVESSGFADRIDLVLADMFSGLVKEKENFFDAIVSNPPYVSDRDIEFLDPWVKAEPRIALYGGERGMDHISAICSQAPKYIKKGGVVILEIGYDQSDPVRKKMKENGFSDINFYRDTNGFSRVVTGRKNG